MKPGFVALLANTMPKELIHEQLREACEEYHKVPTKENEEKVEIFALVFLAKTTTEQHKDGIDGIVKDLEDLDKAQKFIRPSEN